MSVMSCYISGLLNQLCLAEIEIESGVVNCKFFWALLVLMSLMSGSISALLNQLFSAKIVSVGTKAFSGLEPERNHFF